MCGLGNLRLYFEQILEFISSNECGPIQDCLLRTCFTFLGAYISKLKEGLNLF